MNRAHNAQEAINCIKDAQKIGFENLSVDLIYGTPTMNNERWQKNLQIVFDLKIPHVSCYALTVEEKTELASLIKKKKRSEPSDELMAQQFSILLDEMSKHNYTHYEISNFCREPHFAKHNTNYWKGVPYLGIGASAHSYDGVKRYWNIANNALYAKKILNNELANESEILSETDAYNEYVMTSIRTIFGTHASKIKQDFGDDFLKHFFIRNFFLLLLITGLPKRMEFIRLLIQGNYFVIILLRIYFWKMSNYYINLPHKQVQYIQQQQKK